MCYYFFFEEIHFNLLSFQSEEQNDLVFIYISEVMLHCHTGGLFKFYFKDHKLHLWARKIKEP